MTCRAPSSSQTCSGTPTGQALTYDALNRLTQWQNAQSSHTSTAYDGAGQRVWQQTSSGGVTTTTSYYGGWEEVSSNGTTTTTTQYFQAGPITAVSVNGTLSYLVHDLLGSVGAALSTTGTLSAASIYGPWGNVLYRTGTMPTAKGFTGQYGDAATGLDYYGARYYDPVAGQFISADTKQGPNRYAYVGGNPETWTDPSGYQTVCDASCLGGLVGAGTAGVAAAPEIAVGALVLGLAAIGGYAAYQIFHRDMSGTAVPAQTCAAGICASTTTDSYYQGPGAATPSGNAGSSFIIAALMAITALLPTLKGIQATQIPAATTGTGTTTLPPATTGMGTTTLPPPVYTHPATNVVWPMVLTQTIVNTKGNPYPTIIDPRTNSPIPFPGSNPQRVPPGQRVSYDGSYDRAIFIKAWYDAGYAGLNWGQVQLHHILPREFGGDNDFWNIVPLTPGDHLLFTNWWEWFR